MRIRFFMFFLMFSVVFPIFSATEVPSNSGSGSSQLGKPTVKFKEMKLTNRLLPE